jgi:hypothetical protein
VSETADQQVGQQMFPIDIESGEASFEVVAQRPFPQKR